MAKFTHTKKQIRKYGTFDEINILKQKKISINEKIRELIRKEKYSLAEYTINNYIEKYGIDCYILHEQARYKAAINEIEEAKKIYKEIIEQDYENKYYSMYELAKLESEDGNYLQAISYLEGIVSSNHRDKSHALLEIAKNLNYMGENNKAKEYLNIIIKNDMDNKYLAMESMAMVLLDEYKLRQASNYIDKVKNKIDSANYKYLKGSLEFKKDNFLKGKEYFEDILQNERNFKTKATCALGNIEYELENYERSIEIFEQMTPYDKSYYIEAIKKIASCYIKLLKFDKAEEYIKLLDTENNKHLNEQNFLYGRLYHLKQDYLQALSFFCKIDIDANSLYADSLYNICCILIKIEQYDNIFEELDKLEQADQYHRYSDRIHTMRLFVSKKLNQQVQIEANRYTDSLIIDYDENTVLKHIEKHKYEDESNDKHTIFNDDINIEEIYNHAINNLNEQNFCFNDFVDIYLIPYESVGVKDGREINYIKVVTLPNSNKVITMYPYYNFSIEKQHKQKKMSRIDKFNLKYGINK